MIEEYCTVVQMEVGPSDCTLLSLVEQISPHISGKGRCYQYFPPLGSGPDYCSPVYDHTLRLGCRRLETRLLVKVMLCICQSQVLALCKWHVVTKRVYVQNSPYRSPVNHESVVGIPSSLSLISGYPCTRSKLLYIKKCRLKIGGFPRGVVISGSD